MAREGEAEILTRWGLKGAGIKEESSSREAFSVCQLSQARELPSNGNRARKGRGESSSERARGGEMKESREGETAPLRKLCI